MKNRNYSHGMRVVVCDAEWVIRRSVLSAVGEHLIECEGISELVRGKEEPVERTIEYIAPSTNATAMMITTPSVPKSNAVLCEDV